MLKRLIHKFSQNKKIENPNEDKKKRLILIGMIVLLGLVGFFLLNFMQQPSAKITHRNQKAKASLIKDSQFSEDDITSAQKLQQSSIKELTSSLKAQSKEIAKLQKQLKQEKDRASANKKDILTEFNQKLIQLKNDQKSKEAVYKESVKKNQVRPAPKGQRLDGTQTSGNENAFGNQKQINFNPNALTPTVQSFSNPYVKAKEESKDTYKRTYKNFIPTGTFCRAILLGGADASAAVNGQSDTSPILFKITNNCILPNGKRSVLKGAFVTASVYGRISSERGEVRLDNLSLVRKNGSILDMPVEGTAFDIGGKNGIRGIPVLRNDKILQMAGVSGFLSGIGGAIDQSSQTTSTSALGSTTTLTGGDVFKAGLGQGAETALGKIADYQIKLAEQYSPIIQLKAGAIVDLVFLKGFPIEDEKMINRYSSSVNNARQSEKIQEQVQTIQIPTNPLMNSAPKSMAQSGFSQTMSYNDQFNKIQQDVIAK
ncbi:TraB/VirB10 family protein [Thiotrichales bacterium 19S11-10]|nr:TraB/VirB10 family protein [Thiotrichales bacterium 19S11-10]